MPTIACALLLLVALAAVCRPLRFATLRSLLLHSQIEAELRGDASRRSGADAAGPPATDRAFRSIECSIESFNYM